MSLLGKVLVLDDDADVLKAARLALAGEAEAVETWGSPEALEAGLQPGRFDVVLLDMNFAPGEHGGGEGMDALARIREADPDLSVVLMTVYGAVSLAVQGLKRGAADFVLKPWRNDKLVEALAAAAVRTREARAGRNTLNLDALERQAIERALARHEGNVTQAAAALGLTRPALYRRMAKHGLQG